MSPQQNFDQRLLWLGATVAMHNARCLDANGLLDDTARHSIRAHLSDLRELAPSQAAERGVDTLSRILR